MGLFGFVTLFAITAIVALEGYNQTLAGKAQTDATNFITTLAKQYGFNAALILPHLANLRFVALSAILALVFSPSAWVSAIYLILTRGLHLQTNFQKVLSTVSAKGIEGINGVATELTYLLTTVALITYLLSFGGRIFASSPKNAGVTPRA